MNETIMNSLNDIISAKADDLFGDDLIDEVKLDEVKTDIDKKIDDNIPHLKSMIYQMKDQLDAMLRIIEGKPFDSAQGKAEVDPKIKTLNTGERIIEGIFNGEKMIGADDKEYSIPPNYASKSKLVEGDKMKLTITNNGSFIFKQIGPTERQSLIGELTIVGEQYSVLVDKKLYKVLTASVTFYKGKSGDEAVILVPKNSASDWAAVDNIITKNH